MSNNPGLGFSFKLNKKKEKFAAPVLAAKRSDEDGVEIITAIDENQIESTKPVATKGPLVIPLIQNNNWRQQAKERKESKKIRIKVENDEEITESTQEIRVKDESEIKQERELSLEEQATQELLNEAREFNENFEERNRLASKKVIPLLLINKVPDGFEEDDNFDVSARPDDPTMDDYSKVPIEEYGMALLRGMGFKPEESKSIEPIEVKIRPKGLGLGAEIPKPASKKNTPSNTAEKLELKVGAHVLILAQEYKDFYGTIEGFDEDLSRATVRLAINSLSVSVPVFTLHLVPKDEFKREGKILNRSSYTKYKKETEEGKDRNGKEKSRNESTADKDSRDCNEKPSSSSSPKHESHLSSWIHPNLRVRIIDKHYKKRKYYEKKVVIQDVLTPTICNCITDRGENLEEIEAKMLETVVPRDLGSKVMVLRGQNKGELGKLIDRNRDRHEVTIQLISDPLVIEKLHFDDVCEYV